MKVRARARGDLVNLLKLIPDRKKYEVLTSWDRDYPYRIIVPPEVWTAVVTKMAASISYDNHKSACAGGPLGWKQLHEVWLAMTGHEDEEAVAGRGGPFEG